MKITVLSALLLLAAPLTAAAQQLTPQETALVNSCSENATLKIFDPRKAQDCLDALSDNNYRLLNKYKRRSDVAAATLMSQLEAVKDLEEVFTAAKDTYTLLTALKVRLEEASPCVLCSMELGPQPDKLYPWLTRYAADKLAGTKECALDWATIPAEASAFLSSRNNIAGNWHNFTISNRERILSAWASVELDKILPAGATRFDVPTHIGMLEKIWPFLSDQQKGKVIAALEGAKADAAAAAASGATTEKKFQAETKRLGELQSRLSAMNGSDAAGFLNRAFDNNSASGGVAISPSGGGQQARLAGGGAGGPQSLTDAQARAITPRLLTALTGPNGELADTQIGREAIAFMKTPGGKLDFAVVRMQDSYTRGAFNPVAGTVRLNAADVEAAMRKANITTADLMKEDNTEAMAKVARYVAPVFVHEYDGHQKQTAWANSKKIPDLYYIGQETEAFSKGALFVLQKSQAEQRKGNTEYASQIAEDDVLMARLLKAEGTSGVGRQVMYYNVNSQRGKAAENFALYEELKKEIALRAEAARKDPAAEAKKDKNRPAGLKTEELKFRFRTIYSWYREAAKKSEQENKYFESALNALDRQGRS